MKINTFILGGIYVKIFFFSVIVQILNAKYSLSCYICYNNGNVTSPDLPFNQNKVTHNLQIHQKFADGI